jgi:hypothetical protein
LARNLQNMKQFQNCISDMKNTQILILLFLPAIITAQQVQCNRNEEWVCGPPHDYEATCNENPDASGAPCRQGCFCVQGYVRSSLQEKRCIRPSDCLSCPEHTHFRMCGLNPLCLGSCDNWSGTDTCSTDCHKNCQCNDGHVRVSDTNFTCVPVENCLHMPPIE